MGSWGALARGLKRAEPTSTWALLKTSLTSLSSEETHPMSAGRKSNHDLSAVRSPARHLYVTAEGEKEHYLDNK